jgi:hypothetical protein
MFRVAQHDNQSGILLDLRILNMRRENAIQEMNAKFLTVLVLSFTSVAFAEDFETLNGKEYKDATISRVEPDGIVLTSKSGVSKVYFSELPKEVQDRFHYNPGKAADYDAVLALQARLQALQAHYQELEKQEDDLLLTIGRAEVGTYSGYPNPLRSQLPFLHNRLDQVRLEKDQVRKDSDQVSKELEKAQRQKQ